MDFALAFITPRPQTVNLALKHNVTRAIVVPRANLVFSSRFFGKVLEFVDKAQFQVHLLTQAAYLGCKAVEKTSIIRTVTLEEFERTLDNFLPRTTKAFTRRFTRLFRENFHVC